LVNARAPQLALHKRILNDRFNQQYHGWLKTLSYKDGLTDTDELAATYYLLLQDRVAEALAMFKKVDPNNVVSRLQYDYIAGYTAMYSEDLKLARTMAKKHLDHPVPRWRDRFVQLNHQLDEIDGDSPNVTDEENRNQQQLAMASTDKTFEFKVEDRRVLVNYQNLEDATVNYYAMDIELLFSRNPFVQQQANHFAYVRPNHTHTVKLGKNKNLHQFELPEQFHSSNVMVEIVAGGQRKSAAYYANTMNLNVIENYGHLLVADDKARKGLAKTYVKVYARMKGGDVRFLKDGYTDLRGRFDYTSLNTDEINQVDRLALLVLNDEHGAVVREVPPPKL
jgi:hypothetical protein